MDWTQFDVSELHAGKHEQVSRDLIGQKVKREAERLSSWNATCQELLNDFIKNEDIYSLGFPPMDKVFRYIIHEVADELGLPSYSFGEELKDRHTVVYKKGYEPSKELLKRWQAVHERKPDAFVS
ncbi:Sperm-associated antigen 7 [Balamuthia mandrillaris]